MLKAHRDCQASGDPDSVEDSWKVSKETPEGDENMARQYDEDIMAEFSKLERMISEQV